MSQDDRISITVRQVLEKYLHDLDGERSHNIYSMLLEKVERPLLEGVLSYTKGNQTFAANLLGINRNTLRKKIKIYRIE
jgi:Fis family transcriptional regulator